MNFFPLKFIHWKFTNNISWMLASIDMSWNIICSAILPSSLRYFTIPICQIMKSRFLFGYIATLNVPICQVHIAKEQWPAVKSMLPSQHSKAANSTSPRWDCQIAKSKFTLWTALQLPKEIKVSGLNNAWIFSIPLKLLALKN